MSSAVKLLTNDELKDILVTARRNNQQNHITGILLYSDGAFMQVLEGENEAVDSTFAVIEKDSRHKSVVKLLDKSLPERNFPEWLMGFAMPRMGFNREIEGYLKSPSSLLANDNGHAAFSVLKTFIMANS